MEKTEGGKPPLSYDKQKHQCLLSERSERPTSPLKKKDKGILTTIIDIMRSVAELILLMIFININNNND
jgi:hypothetical protein